jgi:predicted 2-oxoglutarate/Fe(II)-dependent dioxygenase YbiX
MADSAEPHQAFVLKGHIQRGDPAPWWRQGRHRFAFDPAGGRYIVLCFYGTARDAMGQAALRALDGNRRFVEDGTASFFGVSADPADKTALQVDAQYPALQFLWDLDATVHRAYGIASRAWIVLDPMLRVLDVIPFGADGADIRQLLALLESLPPPSRYLGDETTAPVLLLPDVFEPEFCRHLIGCYEAAGGRESGFMQEIGGKAVESYDPAWKRRRDCLITDAALIELITARVARRIGLMLQRAFHFTIAHMERHLVACYAAEDGGHFGPHRDDTVKATEHRRFAISINLNEDFDGGAVSFPEFGPRQFKAPVGAALIFSSSLLHRVGRVTRGRRYAFLPFVHDAAAEALRVANLRFLAPPPAVPDAAPKA